jgi:hypothetical protein
LNSAVKNILKASIVVYRGSKDPAKTIAGEQQIYNDLIKQPLSGARGTATQNRCRAAEIFLRIFKPRPVMEHHKEDINHSDRAHALLSASGASKWTKCTPSARLEEFFPEESSEFAEEGTLAHEVAEIYLKADLDIFDGAEAMDRIALLSDSEFYSDGLCEFVTSHVDYIVAQYTEARRITPDAVILIEEKVDLTHLIPDSFGTCDTIIIADGVLEVIDLKYGLGIPVKAENNKQLMLYASGALEAFDLCYDIKTVRLTISQPRLDSISSWELTTDELRTWGDQELKPLAAIAFEGTGEQVTGDHCQFCKAAPRCRARADEAKALLSKQFADPRLLQDFEVLELFAVSDNIGAWVKKLNAYVFNEAMSGKEWPGYKLVDGQNRRAWTDPAAVIAELELSYPAEKIVNPGKVKGIGEIEKLVGKNMFPTLLGEFVASTRTAPKLVPEDDKRPRRGIEQALEDFADDIDDIL